MIKGSYSMLRSHGHFDQCGNKCVSQTMGLELKTSVDYRRTLDVRLMLNIKWTCKTLEKPLVYLRLTTSLLFKQAFIRGSGMMSAPS